MNDDMNDVVANNNQCESISGVFVIANEREKTDSIACK